MDGSACSIEVTMYESYASYNGHEYYSYEYIQDEFEKNYPIGSTHDLYLTNNGNVRLSIYSLTGYIIWISITGCMSCVFLLTFVSELHKEYVDLRNHPEKRGNKVVPEDNAQGGLMPTTEIQAPAQPPPVNKPLTSSDSLAWYDE